MTRFVLVFTVFVSSATSLPGQKLIMDLVDPQYQNAGILYSKKSILESPLLFDEFKYAQIILSDGSKIDNQEVNFDIYEGRLLLKRDNNILVLVPSHVNSVEIKGTKPMIFERLNKNQYFQALFKGKYSLYKLTEKALRDVKESSTTGYHDNESKTSFRLVEEHYIYTKEGLQKIKLSNKSFLNLFSGHSEMEAFLKKNKVRSEQDAIEVFSYFESL